MSTEPEYTDGHSVSCDLLPRTLHPALHPALRIVRVGFHMYTYSFEVSWLLSVFVCFLEDLPAQASAEQGSVPDRGTGSRRGDRAT